MTVSRRDVGYRFSYQNEAEFLDVVRKLGVALPWSTDISPLSQPLDVHGLRLPNRLAVQPMEGFDADSDGCPGELTSRRYLRYAAGGAGLIWFEATAVTAEGRSNPHQLFLHSGSTAEFAKLVEAVQTEARSTFGDGHKPVTVLQLTHSGRWSKPYGERRPVIAHHNPDLDKLVGIDPSCECVSDTELEALQQSFVAAAQLASDAGFDAVDVKACHGYLVSELLGGFTRAGAYGGRFENRARFVLETVRQIREEVPSLQVFCRFNAFDGLRHPFGFGVDRADLSVPDLEEPERLLSEMELQGVSVANVTIGVPYVRPYLGRPFLRPVRGTPRSPEHPIIGVSRLLGIAATLQRAVPLLPVVGTGYSYLRHFFPQVASGAISAGEAAVAGVGRLAFAYPDFARDLLDRGSLDTEKCCLACSGCTELMRAGGPTGCVVRDRGRYRLPRPERSS